MSAAHRPRLRICVIGGGENCEHTVGLATARSVCAFLDPLRYEVLALTIARDGTWLDARGRPLPGGIADAVELIGSCDLAFPAVHGPRGEDGTLAALFELAHVPYVGSGVRTGALAMDKWATKLVAAEVGIRTARGTLLRRELPVPAVGLPAVVKPVAAGSSYGVTRVDDRPALDRAVEDAFGFDDRVLVEELLVGREIDVAVLERADGELLVGPPLEIVIPADALFDTDRKYDGDPGFLVPAPLSEADRRLLVSAALDMFRALGCSGIARVDFFLTEDGPVLNEVNTMPGLTEHSQVPKIFAAHGMPYTQLLDELVATALARR